MSFSSADSTSNFWTNRINQPSDDGNGSVLSAVVIRRSSRIYLSSRCNDKNRLFYWISVDVASYAQTRMKTRQKEITR